MKKFISILILLAVFVSGCSVENKNAPFKNTTGEIQYETDKEYVSFEEAVQQATDVIVATFKGYHKHDYYTELEFEISEILKGETEESTIYVFETISGVSVTGEKETSYTTGQCNFIQGNDYLLILEREISVYYEHDRYTMVGEIFLPLDDDIGYYMYNQPIKEFSGQLHTHENANSITSVVKELCETEQNEVTFYGSEYVTSTDIDVILEQSDYIVRVHVDEQMIEGVLNNTQTYSCTITELLKGEFTEDEKEEWENVIYVIFPKDEVSAGEEYILLLNRADTSSRLFVYSSKNSIFQVANEEEAQHLYNEFGY